MFEPKTLAENELVYKVAKNIIDLHTNGAWIGVTDKSEESSFKYDSNGSLVSLRFFHYIQKKYICLIEYKTCPCPTDKTKM